MRLYNPQEPFIAPRSSKLTKIIEFIRSTNGYPVTLINNDSTLFGIISNGDIIRYLSKSKNIAIEEINAEEVANQFPKSVNISDSYETIDGFLSNKSIRSLPILNDKREVKKIVTCQNPSIVIGSKNINEFEEPFLIGEIGVNHNGDLKEAKYLIREASKAGCDAIKFQYRSTQLYFKNDINKYDLGTQYILSEIDKTRMSIMEIEECCKLAKDLNLEIILTPFDEIALNEICDSEIILSAIKIASCDLTNASLIKAAANLEIPLIVSTGMSYEREILSTSIQLRNLFVDHAFLHCNSTYPSPIEDSNLKYISRLKDITKTIVGYSSHEGDMTIPLCSISHGAQIVEFHITRSRESKGTDHRASIETSELNEFVRKSKLIYIASGTTSPRHPTQGELANRITLGKSYALKTNKKKGERIKESDLVLVSPGSGYQVKDKEFLINKKLKKDYFARSILTRDSIEIKIDLKQNELKESLLNLQNVGYQVGIPVRYHDFELLNNIFKTSMVEFHMSDRDINLEINKYIKTNYHNVDLIVHAIEQYEDGFILDLASSEKTIRERSVEEVKRLFNHVDKLRDYFKYQKSIPIVLNLGGFTKTYFQDDETYKKTLETAVKELSKLNENYKEYSILPQTMPPFPWHQGGRNFHNLLTNFKKLKEFLDATDNYICLDISHTALSCEYFKESVIDHIKCIGKRIGHIHLSDAEGKNSEGLEVGHGNLKFKEIHKAIKEYKNQVYLLPEIWQGHLNQGEPFLNSIIRFDELINS